MIQADAHPARQTLGSDVLAGSMVGLTVSALIASFWLRRLAAGDAQPSLA